MSRHMVLGLGFLFVFQLGCAPKKSSTMEVAIPSDMAPTSDVVETLHGVEVADPYRILETPDAPEVQKWDASRNARFKGYTDRLDQRQWVYDRFQKLWRFDDEGLPSRCLLSERSFVWSRKADQDKWVVYMTESDDGDKRLVLDPNTWPETDTLADFSPSPDCRYLVYGTAKAGDENPVLRVLDLNTMEVTEDTMTGWKQGGVAWLHDNSGFYFTAKPLEGTVAEGDHQYYHRTWFHKLGTTADSDVLFHWDDETKETWNYVSISEDGRWMMKYRGLFNKSSFWLRDLKDPDGKDIVVTDGMKHESWAAVLDGKLFIYTDRDAPNYRLMVADVGAPGEENWKDLIPANDDVLNSVSYVGGLIFARYLHSASSLIKVYKPDGSFVHDVKLPTVGSANISGHWSRSEYRMSFSSFAHPVALYTYHPESGDLALLKESPIEVDTSNMMVEQVWYPSKDGTKVSMFIVRRKDAPRDGSVPTMLYGYGGFNISLLPRYSATNVVWLESGGQMAIPNLRGGGEYGVAWHEAGMLDKKQNVFDDFIAAAEYLIQEGYTQKDRLAIRGGSNGGLLVSAAVTQRPDLYKAVLCQVPLTDMVRFHRFGIANIWTEEYGSADDPKMFPHIYKYSPYHQVKKGTDYPAVLVTGSLNDARTDPVHARKFAAAIRAADIDYGEKQPILLHLQGESGHGGGVTIDVSADQSARNLAFLMEQIGLKVPVEENSAPNPSQSE